MKSKTKHNFLFKKNLATISMILFSLIFCSTKNFAANYAVTIGDILDIQVLNRKELDTKQPIAPDGTISLPLVGRIAVQDKTLAQLDTLFKQLFAKYIENPQVTVVVISPKSKTVQQDSNKDIYLVIRDTVKDTVEVKTVKTPQEAKAWMLAGKTTPTQDPQPGDIIQIEIGAKILPIYIVFYDLNKNTYDLKKVPTVQEAKAWLFASGSIFNILRPTGSTTLLNTTATVEQIEPGDIIQTSMGKRPDFLEDNWYKLLTGAGVVIGLYNSLRR